MTKREAWEIVSECIDHGYEGSELDEMAQYIAQFNEAIRIIRQTVLDAALTEIADG